MITAKHLPSYINDNFGQLAIKTENALIMSKHIECYTPHHLHYDTIHSQKIHPTFKRELDV